ncbi:ADP-ribosylglycohydrolase family protein [Streptomyces griseorubiginosus]|uniref:ADP-ribosylglycohydrolase family protein n=1 Tax=Streptomyces griseorubiginosus TaxID=67304 RepID=UPI0033A1F2ED
MVLHAYERWLRTQSLAGPGSGPTSTGPADGLITEDWLYARRAPGNACLSGVAQGHAPDRWLPLEGRPGAVNPDSRGCGAVMRSAPFGLIAQYDHAAFQMAARAPSPRSSPTWSPGTPWRARCCGPRGCCPSPSSRLRSNRGTPTPGHEETTAALERAVAEADDRSVAPPERVGKLRALCGNLLGAAFGDPALPHEWVRRVEGRARLPVPGPRRAAVAR